MSQATRTSFEPGLIDRVVRGVRYMVSGRDPQAPEWFGPQQPMAPAAQEAALARRFDFPAGYNTQIQPRAYEPVSFAQLRALADNLDLLRLVIETRKDLVCKLAFEFKPQDPQKETDQRCAQLQEFFRFPDQEHSWEEWLRMLLEDLLVLDAPTVYPRQTLGGGLYALEPLDGATVKRVIDASGRTPLPPQVAYQQVIKGVPAVDYSRDELIYKPRNVRTHRVYGYLSYFISGKPAAGGKVVSAVTNARYQAPANFAGSKVLVGTLPTAASTTWSLAKNGTSIGQLVIQSNGSASFSTTATTFEVGDVLTVTAATPQDLTLADVTLNLLVTQF